jgi:hypothetical protein
VTAPDHVAATLGGDHSMNILGGVLMAIIGLFMLVCGTVKSDFVVYRLLVARSRILWGDAVHRLFQVSGLIVAVLGILWASGVIWSNG